MVGAHEWRNPDEDLPADFEAKRVEHYEMLHKPLDAGSFVAELREELRGELAVLAAALPGLDWLEIGDRTSGAIQLTPLKAQPEPANLSRTTRSGPDPLGDGAPHRHAQGGIAAHRDAGPVRPGRHP